MVIFDMPYGVFHTREVPWDVPLTKAAVITLIQQLAAVVRNDRCIAWFWINPGWVEIPSPPWVVQAQLKCSWGIEIHIFL